jgi:ribonuclease D
LLGYGLSIGYSNLAKLLLGIELEKGETRSDWLSRPLSAAQIHYAVLDVVFLPKIYHLLQTQLQSMGRTLWLKEECERVQREIDLFEDYEDYYLKVKSAWKLNRCGLAILKELCFWREKEARKKDRPRNHIVKEVALWQIAHDKPTDITELYKIEGMSQRAIRQYGELLLDVVSQTQRLHEDNHPALLLKPLPVLFCSAFVQIN